MAAPQPAVAAHVLAANMDIKQPIVSQMQQLQVQQQPLPAGWLEMKDPSGRTIYFNPASGTSSWRRPVVRQLPPGWVKAQTPDGKPLYVHTATQQCSFEFPAEDSKPVTVTQPAVTNATMPQITRYTSTPAQSVAQMLPANPRLVRSTTAPVTVPTRMPVKSQDPALMTMTVNTAVARKAIPGFDEALTIHQLSQRNNTQVLGKKLGADVAHASVALKDTTITAASLATRQAKAVGQTMVSATKMQKASKKAIVHTGALGVKLGRASKHLMHEMVDAADGKGKYKPKVRTFIPQDPVPLASKPSMRVDVIHAYEYEQAATNASMQQVQQAVDPAKPVITGVPIRKPVKRPSVSATVIGNASLQVSAQPVNANVSALQPGPGQIVYVEVDDPSHPTLPSPQVPPLQQGSAKPPRPSIDFSASLDIAANATINIGSPIVENKPPLQPATTLPAHSAPSPQLGHPATTPQASIPETHQTQVLPSSPVLQQVTAAQPSQVANTTSAALTVHADAQVNAALTYQPQTPLSSQPPPPYSPQIQRPTIQLPAVQRPPRPVSTASYTTPQYTHATAPVATPFVRPTQQSQHAQQAQQMQQIQQVQQAQQVQQIQQIQGLQQLQQAQQVQYIPQPQPISYQIPTQPQPQPQQIIIQQDAQADTYLQTSNMLALQQQMQALQMQQQVSQMQDMQQHQIIAQQQQEQMLSQQQQQQQQIYASAQPTTIQQQPQYEQTTIINDPQSGEDVYFIDDSTTATTEAQPIYQQQETYQQPTLNPQQQTQYTTPNDASSSSALINQSSSPETVLYAQETTTTTMMSSYTDANGEEVMFVEEQHAATAVVAYEDGEGGGVVYAAEEEVQVWEVDDEPAGEVVGGEVGMETEMQVEAAGEIDADVGGGFEEVDCGGGEF